AYLRVVLEDRDLKKLAQLWVSGMSIDWTLLHEAIKPGRISLPTYPFEGKRYWYEEGGQREVASVKSEPTLSMRASALPGKEQEVQRATTTMPSNIPPNMPSNLTGKSSAKANIPMGTGAKPVAEALLERAGPYQGDEVILQIVEGGIAIITLQDRANRNMFTRRFIHGIAARVLQAQQSPGVKTIILTGYDNVFCMGGSREELMTLVEREADFDDFPFLFRGLLECKIPVIAAIQGHALGGGLVFGLFADVVIMSEDGVYSANFMKYGFTPGMGSTLILREKLGANLATEMMFTAKGFSGDELRTRGASLIFRKPEDVLSEALSIARTLCEKPLQPLKVLKRELSGRLLEQLKGIVERELDMHEETFADPEVKRRIQFYFNPGEAVPAETPSQQAPGAVPSLINDDKPVKLTTSDLSLKSVRHNVAKVQATLITTIASVLHLPDKEINGEVSFRELGVDSITGVEIVRDLNSALALNLDAVAIYNYPTASLLAEHICTELDKGNATVAIVGEAESVLNDAASLSQPMSQPMSQPRGEISNVSEAQVSASIIKLVGGVLHLPEEEVSAESSFREMGVDSITGVEIVRDLNAAFRLNLDAVSIYNHPTPTILTQHVCAELNKRQNSEALLDVAQTPVSQLPSDFPQSASSAQVVSQQEVLGRIVAIIGQVLHLPEDEIHGESSFREMGVDSITGVEIVRDVNKAFRLNLDAVAIYNHPTPILLAQHIGTALSTIRKMEVSEVSGRVQDIANTSVSPLPVLQAEPVLPSIDRDSLSTAESPASVSIKLRQPVAMVRRAEETVASNPDTSSIPSLSPSPTVSLVKKGVLELSAVAPATLCQPTSTAGTRDESVQHSVQLRQKPLVGDLGMDQQPVSSRVSPGNIHAQRPEKTVATESAETQRKTEVAIVGMSARLPGAGDVRAFWANLRDGVNSIVEVPKERWDADKYYDPISQTPNKTYCKTGGFIDDVDKFDALFFRISPKEAELMDPQQRIFLEESWKAFEDAGYSELELQKKRCGIFFGAPMSDYQKILVQAGMDTDAEAFTGTAPSILAGRLAYFLNLNGPCITIDTACSSSLVAIHQACQSLAAGECDMALAGGITLMLTPDLLVKTSQIEMVSPTGQCRSFDQQADGAAFSEGVGVVVLKPLEKAIADGDYIYGVVKGSAVNQDGRTNGLTAPSGKAQHNLERDVYRRFGIDPAQISYVEAHGTGTKLGDPIEVKALTEVFSEFTSKKGFCAIGSVKANIGHTSMAAGVAGVIKVLLAMQHRQLPPAVNFNSPNEHIDFENSPFFVNTALTEWRAPANENLKAAVSSFGFSGTNCHLVLEEAPERIRRSAKSQDLQLIVVSARTQEALCQRYLDIVDWFDIHPQTCFEDIIYTLQVGRTHFPLRAALLVSDIGELRHKLLALVDRKTVDDCFYIESGSALRPHVVRSDEVARVLDSLRKPVNATVLRRGLRELAGLYVEGQEVDWHGLYEADEGRRIPLPGYPFARERYWVDKQPEETAEPRSEVLHALVGRNVSTLHEQVFTTRLHDDAFFLADHVVNGSKLLPGVCYLEMARVAASLSLGEPVSHLRNVVWLRPVVVGGDPLDIRISFFAEDDYEDDYEDDNKNDNEDKSIEFEVTSGSEDELCVHAQGVVMFAVTEPGNLPALDFSAIRERCHQQLDIEACYQDASARGLLYGPSFQVLQQLYRGTGEAWAELVLAPHTSGNDDFILHPSLMDGALQTVMGVLPEDAEGNALYLPFAVDDVEIFDHLPSRCFAYVKAKGEITRGIGRFDVWLLDDHGGVLVVMKNYTVKALGSPVGTVLDDESLLALFEGLQSGEVELHDAEQRVQAGGIS
ncbi:MAG: polyketide synthase dehydratase domain-containing protein, partial [Ectothiorhodospiraceae bacterium]|nr:polyketide synthase dehydratase domain-containing protein [Ectothiorhodospiraceae bacterium]